MLVRNLLCAVRDALMLCVLCTGAHADWALSSDPMAIRPYPENEQPVAQNPPGFTWSRHTSGPEAYELEIQSGTAGSQIARTSRNWHLPSTSLKAGRHFWRVRPVGTAEWSTLRSFEILPETPIFEVPDSVLLKARVISRTRPRSLPNESGQIAQWASNTRLERSAALARLSNEVRAQTTTLSQVKDSDWPLQTSGAVSSAKAGQMTLVRQRVNAVSRQFEAAALLFVLTSDRQYLREATSRGQQLATLSPDGPTSQINQDQGNRQIALSLMKAVDWLWGDLDDAVRKLWLTAVARRAGDVYLDLAKNQNGMDQYPLDSHGGTTLGFLAVISALGLGVIPESEKWFDFAVRPYVHFVYPWSGPEGGYANGTAYAQYTADYALQLWQPLASATNINLFAKPWSHGLLQYFTHFLPPGSRTHAFGDDAESQPDTSILKAYASRISTPLAAWYVKNLLGEEDPLSLLQAPRPLPITLAGSVQAPVNAALYSSIGWVAMHSNAADRARTALFFKSSSYGSFNHSHGDQNSFTLMRGGRPLLIDSGWYDYYESPMWKGWYRQTRAHNAITYDGGQGQTVDGYSETFNAKGKITDFSTTPAFDYVEGDATQAYGGALTLAVRGIWYLRSEDAILVWDRVESSTPRLFEWNMHAAGPFKANSKGQITIKNQEQELCLTLLSGDDKQFQKRPAFVTKPGVVEDHAAFVTRDLRKNAEFLVLVDIGCKQPEISVQTRTSAREVVVGNVTLKLSKPTKSAGGP